jgi:hypothetical protein
VGRPKVLNEDGNEKYNIDLMIKAVEKYVDAHKDNVPILKECCFDNGWNYDYVMQLQRDNERLSQSIKRLLYKKEVQLERLGLIGAVDKTMAVFSLKQLGWTDKVETTNTNTDKVVIDFGND